MGGCPNNIHVSLPLFFDAPKFRPWTIRTLSFSRVAESPLASNRVVCTADDVDGSFGTDRFVSKCVTWGGSYPKTSYHEYEEEEEEEEEEDSLVLKFNVKSTVFTVRNTGLEMFVYQSVYILSLH